MNKQLSSDSIALTKGANSKIRAWYLKNLNSNRRLFMPSLNKAILSVPYVKEESKEEVMKLWIQHLYFRMKIESIKKLN